MVMPGLYSGSFVQALQLGTFEIALPIGHRQQWGASTDIPVPGEYGGFSGRDGKSDIGRLRPSNGTGNF